MHAHQPQTSTPISTSVFDAGHALQPRPFSSSSALENELEQIDPATADTGEFSAVAKPHRGFNFANIAVFPSERTVPSSINRSLLQAKHQDSSASHEMNPNSIHSIDTIPSRPFLVQRYVENIPDLMDGKVSEGGHIAVKDKQAAYASAPKIEEAQNSLKESKAKITIQQGDKLDLDYEKWAKTFGHPSPLFKIKPVYKENTLSPGQAKHEPVSGDDNQTQQQKLKAYKESLKPNFDQIGELYAKIFIAWKEQENKYSGLGKITQENPHKVVLAAYRQKIVELIGKTVGAIWNAQDVAKKITLQSSNDVKLEDFSDLFKQLTQDYVAKLKQTALAESPIDDLLISLPNDCKAAAQLITGKSATALSQENANPDVGDNYYTSFGTEYGWGTHYASVIMKDKGLENTDNLSYEAAADFQAPVEEGKSLGFFEMYGTQKPMQTFEHQIVEKQKAYIKKQTDSWLEPLADGQEAQAMKDKRDKDYQKLDNRQKKLRGEEV